MFTLAFTFFSDGGMLPYCLSIAFHLIAYSSIQVYAKITLVTDKMF